MACGGCAAGQARFRLRAVYQMNCYGESLAAEWLSLGAQAVNGAVGVNWLPEPSLSVFLRNWLGGRPFGEAVARSYRAASRALGLVWRAQDGQIHPEDRIEFVCWCLGMATCGSVEIPIMKRVHSK